MISFLKGELVEKDPDRLVVLVGGVGFEVRAPAGTVDRAPDVGSRVSLYTHMHVREDCMQLYGFETRGARDLFVDLMGLSGFGAAKALAVLSCFSPKDFKAAIMTGDADVLAGRIPGVGKKSAERLILELKDKFEPSEADFAGVPSEGKTVFREAVEALVTLDFTVYEANEMLKKFEFKTGAEPTLEELLQFALQQRGRSR